MVSDCALSSVQRIPASFVSDPAGSPDSRADENALLTAAKNGQTTAFDHLWKPYANRLLRTTYRITRNQEDARDALQNALLNAFLHIRSFDGRASFSTWLTRIAINSARMLVRKNQIPAQMSSNRTGSNDRETATERLRDSAPDPEARYAQRERECILTDAIDRLGPNIRDAIVLRALEERPLRETARIMGISVAAAKTRVFRATRALNDSLKRKSFSPSAAAIQMNPR